MKLNKIKNIDITNNILAKYVLSERGRLEFNIVGDEHRVFNSAPPLSNRLFRNVATACDEEVFFRCFAKKFKDETLKDKIASTKMLLKVAGLENVGIDVTYTNDGFSKTVECDSIEQVYKEALELMKSEFTAYNFKYKVIIVDGKVMVEQDLYRLLNRFDNLVYNLGDKSRKLFSFSNGEYDYKRYDVVKMINHLYEEMYGEKFTRIISVFIETEKKKRTMYVPIDKLEQWIENEIYNELNGIDEMSVFKTIKIQ